MIKNHQILEELSSGGGSNTPPVDTIDVFDKPKLEKRVLIDWLSVTLDFVKVYHQGLNIYELDHYSPLLKQLVGFFGWNLPTSEMPRLKKVVRGYTNGYELGENIRLLFGGEHTKTADGNYSINLLMSGEACREFENFMDGNWNDLLSFLLINKAKVKRIDIAIDDFDGEQITIYQIKDIVEKRYYVSPTQTTKIIIEDGMREGLRVTTGYSITFGAASSNQLQIYDKKLERIAKGSPDIDTDVWYRYEMRFVDEKAQAIAETYTVSVKENQSEVFMDLAQANLYKFLDLKVYNPNDTNISRWKTDPRWIDFLDAVSKIDLKIKHKVASTMIQKKLWFEESLHKFSAQMLAYLDFNEYQQFNYETIIKGIEAMFGDEKSLSTINNGRAVKGLKALTWEDIDEIRQTLKYYLDKEE